MQYLSRWTPAAVALCFTAACSDSQTVTAPVAPTSISADVGTLATCQSQLEALRAAITGATFTGKSGETERTHLLAKVTEAETKLAEGKTTDAVAKLADIRASVTALSTPDAKGKTKLDAASATTIIEAVANAEACILPDETSAGA